MKATPVEVPPQRQRTIRRLYARLARRFELYDEQIPVGPLRVQFTRVADPEKVLDALCERIDAHERATGQRVNSDALGLPYWAELWDSAIGIAQWIAAGGMDRVIKIDRGPLAPPPTARPPLRVMDLGCGMGLAGTVAALMGADVLFADIERDCLLFSALNAARYSDRARARKVNWQTDTLGERFDLIIGSDVLYDKTQWPFLDTFFRNHLADDGWVMLGEPGRMSGDLFVPWIQSRGWNLKRFEQPVPTRTTPIRLFELLMSES